MSKVIKQAILDELERDLQGVESCIVVGFEGLKPGDATTVRKNLRSRNMRMRVVKNSLAVRAFEASGKAGFGAALSGQSAVIFAKDEDAIAVAKAVVAEKASVKALVFRGAWLDGRVLDAREAEGLSRFPGRSELLAMVLAGAIGPLTEMNGLLNGLLTETEGLIAALAEKRGKEPGSADGAAA